MIFLQSDSHIKVIWMNLIVMHKKEHANVLMYSTQIDARKEQLALAKTELKQAKKEAKSSSDPKLQT